MRFRLLRTSRDEEAVAKTSHWLLTDFSLVKYYFVHFTSYFFDDNAAPSTCLHHARDLWHNPIRLGWKRVQGYNSPRVVGVHKVQDPGLQRQDDNSTVRSPDCGGVWRTSPPPSFWKCLPRELYTTLYSFKKCFSWGNTICSKCSKFILLVLQYHFIVLWPKYIWIDHIMTIIWW